jgi:hypothetical protein
MIVKTYRMAEKWRKFGLWKLVLFLRLWKEMDTADRNYVRDFVQRPTGD